MKSSSCLALGIVLSFATAAAAVDITACDQEVPAGQTGVLTTDLDCSSDTEPGSYAVELERGATLDMQGHTITGPQWAVYCPGPGKCTVTSTTGTPGTLKGAEAGIWTPASKVVVSNVHLAGNAYAISNNPKTTLTDVSFADNGFALSTQSLRATNVTVTGECGNGYCLDMGKGRIDGLVTADTGPSATVVQVRGALVLRNASMSGSPGQVGILATSIRVTNGVVTGHGVDLASRSLRVVDVSCDQSRRFDKDGFAMGTWGICAND
jgi:hypothetical protein